MRLRDTLLASAALALVCAGQAAAQTAGKPADDQGQSGAPEATAARAKAAQAKGGALVEELVVTAQKRIDELKDAPVSVTTFTAEQRNLTATNTITDLVALTPGVTISGNGLNIRGVGRQTSETATLGAVSGAAYYVNGFYEVVAANVGESTLYSEYVQFERGPQGTRGGRGAIGGAAYLLARHPTSEMHGEVVGQYGSNGFWGAGANVAGPINDRWGFRLGYQHFDAEDSVQHNVFPTTAGGLVRNNYMEFQLEGRPSDHFHVWLRSTTFSYTDPAFYGKPPFYQTTAPMGSLVPNPTFGYTTPVPSDPRAINVDTRGIDKLRDNMVHILNADYDFGKVTLYYTGGYLQYKATGYSDLDQAGRISYVACTPSASVVCAPGTVPNSGFPNNRVISTRQLQDYNNRDHYYTHEVRLQNNDTSRVDWVVGAFYYNSVYDEFYEQTLPDEPALATPIASFVTFAAGPPNPSRSFYQQHNLYKTSSAAVFGDVIFHATPSLDVFGGLRYSHEKGLGVTNVRYTFFNPAFVLALDVTPGTPSGAVGKPGGSSTYSDNEWTGRFGVDYHLSDDGLVYAKYSRGYKPNAFNLGNVTSVTNNAQVAAPETLNAYELGWKQRFGRTLNTTATFFYYDYHDMQIIVPQADPVSGRPNSFYANFDKARSWGIELDGTWTPLRQVWLNANYTYLDAETVHFCCAHDPLDPVATHFVALDGKPLPRSPKHKASISGAYTWDFTPGSLILGGNLSYIADQQQDAFDNPAFRLPGYALMNLSITWRSADNHYELAVQGSNIFDKLYDTSIAAVTNGAGQIVTSPAYGGPRFVGGVLRYRF
jgi:iron complex outermembrane receptor protein